MLALKGNQGTLRDDVEPLFAEQKALKFRDLKIDRTETIEKSARLEEHRHDRKPPRDR